MSDIESAKTNPELDAALRAYHDEMRDGTERSQRLAFERLRQLRQTLGGAAVVQSIEKEPIRPTSNEELAAS